MIEPGAITAKSRIVDLSHLRLACGTCGEWLPEIRLSPEGTDLVVIYVRPCIQCKPAESPRGGKR